MPTANIKRRREAVDKYRIKHPERVKEQQKRSREKWKNSDPQGYRVYRRKMDLKRKGMTPALFDLYLFSQGNACAICKTIFSSSLKPHIDHDHACCPQNVSCGNCIRGILCGHCNMGLGRFFDDPSRLSAAATYILSRRRKS